MTRAVTELDIPALIEMQRALAAEGALWGYVADSASVWAGRELTWTLLAEHEGQPVGFIHAAPRDYTGECVFSAEDRILEIVEFYVAETHRNQGTGQALFEALEQLAKTARFTHLRVYSAAKRFDDILAFYRRCGFSPWYLEMTKRLPPHAD